MISNQVQACLASLNTLPACSLPQVECMVGDSPQCLWLLVECKLQKALHAEWSRGNSLGHKPMSVCTGKGAAQADMPFTKQSHAKVGGNPPVVASLFPKARDRDEVLSEAIGQLTHPRPMREGQAAYGNLARRVASLTIQPTGEMVRQ